MADSGWGSRPWSSGGGAGAADGERRLPFGGSGQDSRACGESRPEKEQMQGVLGASHGCGRRRRFRNGRSFQRGLGRAWLRCPMLSPCTKTARRIRAAFLKLGGRRGIKPRVPKHVYRNRLPCASSGVLVTKHPKGGKQPSLRSFPEVCGSDEPWLRRLS